jgi:hypothetical protein
MAWRRLRSIRTVVRRRSRLHLDESVPVAVEGLFGARGYNVTTTPRAKLTGHSDTAQAAFAWRQQRALVTFDWDFFKPEDIPRHRLPAIVIFACDSRRSRDVVNTVNTLNQLERLIGPIPRRSRTVVRADGEVSLWTVSDPGEAPDSRYRFDGKWPPLVWT